MKKKRRILVGSKAFFRGVPGFTTKDTDWVEFIKPTPIVKHFCQIRDINGLDVFQVVIEPVEDMIAWTSEHLSPMAVGKFLVPEFIREVGLTFDKIELLKPMIDKLDKKHGYEKIIYEAYLENGDFVLTREQTMNAYNEYIRARNEEQLPHIPDENGGVELETE